MSDITRLILAFLLLASSAAAFPLSGGSDQAHAVVYGVVNGASDDENIDIYVDIGSNLDYYTPVLVDDDDEFYSAVASEDSASGAIRISGVLSSANKRKIWQYVIPRTAVIKRVRLEPQDEGLAPFAIEWQGVPEVSDRNVSIKFYDAQKTDWYFGTNAWVFKLKITNNGTQNLMVHQGDFTIRDQYSWEYPGGDSVVAESGTQLIPGESMKFDLDVLKTSPLSRPVELQYGGLTMDISAWV